MGLFQNNSSFMDISSWDTSNVSNMMGLFPSAFNQDIGYWDVSLNDQNGVNQLFDNDNLNQDLSYWCFPNNQNIYNNRNNIWGNNNPIKNNSSLRPRFSGRSPACREPKVAFIASPTFSNWINNGNDGVIAIPTNNNVTYSDTDQITEAWVKVNNGPTTSSSNHSVRGRFICQGKMIGNYMLNIQVDNYISAEE